MSKLEGLIAELEKAEDGSRWLDAKIDAIIRFGALKMHNGGFEWAWDNFPVWAHHKNSRGLCGVQHTNGDLGLIWESLPFTDSLDAAVALVNRVLPGWRYGLTQGGDSEDAAEFQGNVWPAEQPFPAHLEQDAYHRCAPISLVLATLRAKIAQGEA